MHEPIIAIICNKKCNLIPRVPIVIENAIFIREIPSEHYGAIARFNEKSESDLLPSQKCALIDPTSDLYRNNNSSHIHLALSFSLNLYAKHGIMNFSDVYHSQKKRKFKITKNDKNEIGELLVYNTGNFQIRDNTTPKDIEDIFKTTLSALEKDKSLEVTIKRFILGISRSDYQSKVIDISISLESLYSFNTEISFRFSLFNSLIADSSIEKRHEIFETMKALYDDRSSIVHGTTRTKKDKVEQNWEKIIDVTKYAILYKINFLQSNNNKEAWSRHLLDLSFGAPRT